MNWTETTNPAHKGKVLMSDCGNYLIANKGTRAGSMYALYGKMAATLSGAARTVFARVLRVGEFAEVKDYAEK